MAEFESDKGDIPSIDVRKLDYIISLITTFEEKDDLMTRNVINYYYDNKNDYVFMDIYVLLNNLVISDTLLGFNKDKIINICKNILKYFEQD